MKVENENKEMGKSIVREKAFVFAIRLVRLYKLLCERNEYVLSKQMLRSGTAIGALLKEAEHAQSVADFINKADPFRISLIIKFPITAFSSLQILLL